MDQFSALTSNIFADVNSDEFSRALAIWKFKGQKIVFTHGHFDAIHKGQVEFLAKAAELGDLLIVGLHTDESSKLIKGAEYPSQDEHSRAAVLSSLQYVDVVVFFSGDPTVLIEVIKPDVFVYGIKDEPKDIVGYDAAIKNGGRVEIVETLNYKDTPGFKVQEEGEAEAEEQK